VTRSRCGTEGTRTTTIEAGGPLLSRFPELAALPRADLGTFPSPVERHEASSEWPELWVKRDDLNAPVAGGNKVRALEFLLGGVGAGDTVLTLGGEGSTHVLATAVHAARLGATTVAVRWPHEMSPLARAVAAEARRRCRTIVSAQTPIDAVLRAHLLRLSRPVRYIPPGGSVPVGVLGSVNGALELAEQVERGELPPPVGVVVPLGSGGTAAGLALGFALAGLDTVVIGARVAPRVVSHRRRVLRLAGAAARLIERLTGRPVARPHPSRVAVAHEVYGGAYGRPLATGEHAAAMLVARRGGLSLDATYSAKAYTAALEVARRSRGPTLFWLTFDGRALQGVGSGE
jgi:1-aminocyclopropane-1-carboxylate deaminase/D-cysteine desulfhydrase-like pyridoxal-dependent ACC family enzyme